ncbi:MAG: DNA repair protein RadC [Hahellaceae bacterium]|nr:DNA repair protein RadC [Hahellaceae bacterium]MCP5212225.1 DNA repair protein RadC [Hahellaceae bacterium]
MKQLIQIKDISGNYATVERDSLIQTAVEQIRASFSTNPTLSSSSEAADHIQALIGHLEHEVFYAIWLNSQHQIINHGELFNGTIDSSSVYPREVVKAGLGINAAAVIFAHNHPSGSAEPSQADIKITKRLKDSLELIDIRVLDHFIIGSSVTSMAERGLL